MEKQKSLFLSELEENQDKLYRLCSIYSDNNEDSKDLFQEVLVQIWKSMSAFKGNSSIGTWMFRIALNVCLRFKSKYTKNQNRFIRLDSIAIINISSEVEDKSNDEKLIALRKCVTKLNDAEKAIVALYLEELAYREISEILGLSENHIAVKIKRIKSKLLHCINGIL
tara:strand:- start:255 stop:758 length:504 start_codon:yes stop_codon:yes gene_type:complete